MQINLPREDYLSVTNAPTFKRYDVDQQRGLKELMTLQIFLTLRGT
jgi:hypothetical protein